MEVLGEAPAELEEPGEEASLSPPSQQSEATAHVDAADDVSEEAATPSANASSACLVKEGSSDQLGVPELQSPMQPESGSPGAEGATDEAAEPCEAAIECQGGGPLSHALEAWASNDSLTPEEDPLPLVGDEPSLYIGAPTEEEPQHAEAAPQSGTLPSLEAKASVHPEEIPIDGPEEPQDALPENDMLSSQEPQSPEAEASVHPEDEPIHLPEESEELQGAEVSAPSSPLKGADPVEGAEVDNEVDVTMPGATTFVPEPGVKSPEPGCSSGAAGEWMAGACTNAVYGDDDIRASVQVTTIDSALRARSVTPECPVRASGLQTLVALAEECGEEGEEGFGLGEDAPVVAEQPAAAAAEPGCSNGTEGTPAAAVKTPGAAAVGLFVEVEEPNDMAEMMELLMLGVTPSPGNKAASGGAGKIPSPDGDIVDSFLMSLGPDDRSGPETTPLSGGNDHSGAALSPPPTAVASVPATAAAEEDKGEPGSVPATVAQSEKAVFDASATFQSPLTR